MNDKEDGTEDINTEDKVKEEKRRQEKYTENRENVNKSNRVTEGNEMKKKKNDREERKDRITEDTQVQCYHHCASHRGRCSQCDVHSVWRKGREERRNGRWMKSGEDVLRVIIKK